MVIHCGMNVIRIMSVNGFLRGSPLSHCLDWPSGRGGDTMMKYLRLPTACLQHKKQYQHFFVQTVVDWNQENIVKAGSASAFT